MTRLYLSRVHYPVTTLGPGRRLGIWFQGCSIRCPGCISVDTWAQGRGETGVGRLLAGVRPWLAEADGVTVSGGEPFDQPEALQALLGGLRAGFGGDILVYTGHPRARAAPRLPHIEDLIDALISDPFDASADDTLPLRGSDNQRLHLLTPLGRERFSGYDDAGAKPRALDLMVDGQGDLWFAGIPRRGDFARLRALLFQAGHSAIISEHAERPAS